MVNNRTGKVTNKKLESITYKGVKVTFNKQSSVYNGRSVSGVEFKFKINGYDFYDLHDTKSEALKLAKSQIDEAKVKLNSKVRSVSWEVNGKKTSSSGILKSVSLATIKKNVLKVEPRAKNFKEFTRLKY